MRKLGSLSLVLLLAGGVLSAQDAATAAAADGLVVGGSVNAALQITKLGTADAKVGYGWGDDPLEAKLNFTWTKGGTVFGWHMKQAIADTAGAPGWSANTTFFDEAFGETSLLDGQFRLSAGKLLSQVWKSGGKVDASVDGILGARLEYRPSFLPGFNVGLLLPLVTVPEVKDYFSELGFGAQYKNDWFDVAVGVRLDSGKDIVETAGSWAIKDSLITAGIIKPTDVNLTTKKKTYQFTDIHTGVPAGTTSPPGSSVEISTPDLPTGYEPYFFSNARANDPYWTWTAPIYEEGTKIVWGLGPNLTAIVPGLTFRADGQITGIGAYLGTVTGVKAGFAIAGLDASVAARFETFDKKKGAQAKKTGIYIDPAVSYQVFSWLKPGVEASLAFYTYQDGVEDFYKQGTTKDLAAFDKFGLVLYTDITLGNGITFTPRYALTKKSANGPSLIEDVKVATSAWNTARTDHKFELRFGYSF
jgi:hypothetical protein